MQDERSDKTEKSLPDYLEVNRQLFPSQVGPMRSKYNKHECKFGGLGRLIGHIKLVFRIKLLLAMGK